MTRKVSRISSSVTLRFFRVFMKYGTITLSRNIEKRV